MLIQLYIIGALFVLIPCAFLAIIRKMHKYRFSAIIGGIAAYYFGTQLLIPLVAMMLAQIGLGQGFWDGHSMGGDIVSIFLNSIFHDILLYGILKFTLKKRSTIYDAMAMGVSYWLGTGLNYMLGTIQSIILIQYTNQGRLSELVQEGVTLQDLQQQTQEVLANGAGAYYSELFVIICLLALSTVLCLFFYLSIKKRTASFLLMSMGAHIILLMILQLCNSLGGTIAYLIFNGVILLISVVIFIKFMQWYRRQQKLLLQRRREYKQGLKTVRVEEEKEEAPAEDENASEEEAEEVPVTAPVSEEAEEGPQDPVEDDLK